ncbi:MAG: hypothetical protein LJE65_01015 [Desulfobacteraceae bacterium]|nr:hypothetical protein [Desulfobacteraceae bacterium]
MRRKRQSDMWIAAGTIVAGLSLLGSLFAYSDAVPLEYRNTSPGYGWSWDFDFEGAMRDSGRVGADPWPWPAARTGDRFVLPLGQPLQAGGLTMTYRGMTDAEHFRLEVVLQGLDPDRPYSREMNVERSRNGFSVGDLRFAMERITVKYLQLRSLSG